MLGEFRVLLRLVRQFSPRVGRGRSLGGLAAPVNGAEPKKGVDAASPLMSFVGIITIAFALIGGLDALHSGAGAVYAAIE